MIMKKWTWIWPI